MHTLLNPQENYVTITITHEPSDLYEATDDAIPGVESPLEAAMRKYLDTVPLSDKGYVTDGVVGLSRHIARRFLDETKAELLRPLVEEAIATGKIIAEERARAMHYWPESFFPKS